LVGFPLVGFPLVGFPLVGKVRKDFFSSSSRPKVSKEQRIGSEQKVVTIYSQKLVSGFQRKN